MESAAIPMASEGVIARPIVIAYDGSDEARHAVRVAGEMLKGSAVVVNVYQPPAISAATLGDAAPLLADPELLEKTENREREHARDLTREGAELARAAGFIGPRTRVVSSDAHSVWTSLLEAADECDAAAIVVGHRDLSLLAEKLPGSLALDLVRQAARPVLVIPAAAP